MSFRRASAVTTRPGGRCLAEAMGERYVYMISVRLVTAGSTGGPAVNPQAVSDAVWAHSDPGAGLEHVRVQVHPGQADLVIFCIAESSVQAQVAAARICAGACRSTPMLAGWRIADCGPLCP
jgi:hypothetical protein